MDDYPKDPKIAGLPELTLDQILLEGKEMRSIKNLLALGVGIVFLVGSNLVQADPPYMLVLNWKTGDIVAYDDSGNDLGIWVNTEPACLRPAFTAWGPDGNLYVTCFESNTIHRYSKDGLSLGVFVSEGLSQPEGIAFDATGNLYVANYDSPGNIMHYDSEGISMGAFATNLAGIREIAFDSQGNLYAIQQDTQQIYKISPDGGTPTTFTLAGPVPYGIEIDESDHLYVSLSSNNGIQHFDATGDLIATFHLPEWPAGGYTSLEFGPDGNLYVANSFTGVRRWEPDGTYIGPFTVNRSDCCTNGLAFFPEDSDADGDGVPDGQDICDGGNDNADEDGDSVPDFCDDCPLDAQNDADGDGFCSDVDTCPGFDDNENQDGDILPDGCDVCPLDVFNDQDSDGVCGDIDNCPLEANASQANSDGDSAGDVCDLDDDNDTVDDEQDNCPLDANLDQADFDGDGAGDLCDSDDDNDNVVDNFDECPMTVTGEVVEAGGCSVNDLSPCENENKWKNHGAYVRSVAHTSVDFVAAGLITEVEKDTIVSTAGSSSCGAKK